MSKRVALIVIILLGLLSFFSLIILFSNKEIFNIPTGNIIGSSLSNQQTLREIKKDQTFTVDIETFRPISYFIVRYPLKAKDVQNDKIILQQENNNYEVGINKETNIYFKNTEGIVVGGAAIKLLKVDKGIATLSINNLDIANAKKTSGNTNACTGNNCTTIINNNCGNEYATSKYGFSKCENGKVIALNKYLTLRWKNPIPQDGKHYVIVFRDITAHPKPLQGDPNYVGVRLYKTENGQRTSTFQRPEWEIPLQAGQKDYKIPESKFKPIVNDLGWKSSLCFSTNWLSDDHTYEWWIERRDTPVTIPSDGCYMTKGVGHGNNFIPREEFTIDLYGHGLWTDFGPGCSRPDLASKNNYGMEAKFHIGYTLLKYYSADMIYRMNPNYRSAFYARPSIHTSLRYQDPVQFYPTGVFMHSVPVLGDSVMPGMEPQMLGWNFFSDDNAVNYLRQPVVLNPRAGVSQESVTDKVCEDETHQGVKKSLQYSTVNGKAFSYLGFSSMMKTFKIKDTTDFIRLSSISSMSDNEARNIIEETSPNEYCTFGRREINLDNAEARKYFLSLIFKYHGFSDSYKDQLPIASKKIIEDSFNIKPANTPDINQKPYMGLYIDNIQMRPDNRVFLKTNKNPSELFTNFNRCTKNRPAPINKLFGVPNSQSPTLLPGEYWACTIEQESLLGYTGLLSEAKTLLNQRQLMANIQYGDDYSIERNIPILDQYLTHADTISVQQFIGTGDPNYLYFSDSVHLKNVIDILDYVANVKRKGSVTEMYVNQIEGKPDILLTTYSAFLLAANEKSLLFTIPNRNEAGAHQTPIWSFIQEIATGKPLARYTSVSYGNNCLYATREYENAFTIFNLGSGANPRPKNDNCVLNIHNTHTGYIDARTGQASNSIQLQPTEGTVLFRPDVIRPVMDHIGNVNLNKRNYDCTGTIYESILVPDVPANAKDNIITP
ncbi:MAG: hypothetical protein AABW52_01095 [Nanoarchaeota archaeon]